MVFAHCVCVFLTQTVSAQSSVVALRGANVETISESGAIDGATVIVRDGKIEAVGKDIKVPERAEVIDVSGKTIVPGIIDPYHAVTIAGSATPTIRIGNRTTTSSSRGAASSSTFTRVADSFDPYQSSLRPLLRSGITELNLVTRGFGQAALARVTPESRGSMVTSGDGLLYLALTNQSTSLNVLRSGLRGGRVSTKTSKVSSSGSPKSKTSRPGSNATSSRTRALWQDVRDGKAPLIVNVNNSATILHLLKAIKSQEKVRVHMVSTGANVHRVLQKLKGSRISLILQPTLDFAPSSQNRVNIPRMVNELGIEFAFSLSLSQSTLSASQDAPLFPVAVLVNTGLPRKVALEALTIKPAKMLAMDKTHGSIEPGKVADLLIFRGDPLDPDSELCKVLVEGRTVYEH